MATLLRIELIVLALVIAFSSVSSVNRKKLNIQYALPWIAIAIGVLVVAIWPQLVEWFCHITQIETPANLVFLLAICAVLLLCFHHAKVISKQTNQIRRLTQMLSIRDYENEMEKGERES